MTPDAEKMSPDPENRTEFIALAGLLDMAAEAMFIEFRIELVQTAYADIRPTHGCVFRFVREDGMRLTELASLSGLTKQSLGEIVDDLVGKGYVERIPDPADRRAKLIRLTSKGREAQATGFGLFSKLEQQWADRYGEDRIKQMRTLLEEIVANESPSAAPELQRQALAEA